MLHSSAPLSVRGAHSKTPIGGQKPQIAPNANQLLQLCQECDRSFFVGRHSLSVSCFYFSVQTCSWVCVTIPHLWSMTWCHRCQAPLAGAFIVGSMLSGAIATRFLFRSSNHKFNACSILTQHLAHAVAITLTELVCLSFFFFIFLTISQTEDLFFLYA